MTTLAHIRRAMPTARAEKETTMRSLAAEPLTERSMMINSVRSSAAQTRAKVNGLAEVMASKPNPHRVNEPAQAKAPGKVSLTEAVNKIEIARVARLKRRARSEYRQKRQAIQKKDRRVSRGGS